MTRRFASGATIALVGGLAWAYLLSGAGTGMSVVAMTTAAFPPPQRAAMTATWDGAWWLSMAVMWVVMMVAMMSPLAVTAATAGGASQPAGRSLAYAAGYFAIWGLYAVAATVAQYALEQAGLLHGMLMWSTSLWMSAGLLLAAGLYQFTNVKALALSGCRNCRLKVSGHVGLVAFPAGVADGRQCVVRCALLMPLLFVGGAMNLVWITGLSLLVLVERLLPDMLGRRTIGGVLLAAGAYLAVLAAK